MMKHGTRAGPLAGPEGRQPPARGLGLPRPRPPRAASKLLRQVVCSDLDVLQAAAAELEKGFAAMGLSVQVGRDDGGWDSIPLGCDIGPDPPPLPPVPRLYLFIQGLGTDMFASARPLEDDELGAYAALLTSPSSYSVGKSLRRAHVTG